MEAAFNCGIQQRYLINSKNEMIQKNNNLITNSFKSLYEFSNFLKNSYSF